MFQIWIGHIKYSPFSKSFDINTELNSLSRWLRIATKPLFWHIGYDSGNSCMIPSGRRVIYLQNFIGRRVGKSLIIQIVHEMVIFHKHFYALLLKALFSIWRYGVVCWLTTVLPSASVGGPNGKSQWHNSNVLNVCSFGGEVGSVFFLFYFSLVAVPDTQSRFSFHRMGLIAFAERSLFWPDDIASHSAIMHVEHDGHKSLIKLFHAITLDISIRKHTRQPCASNHRTHIV